MNTGAQTATTSENAVKTMAQTAETPQNAMKTEAQTARTSQNAMKTVVQIAETPQNAMKMTPAGWPNLAAARSSQKTLAKPVCRSPGGGLGEITTQSVPRQPGST